MMEERLASHHAACSLSGSSGAWQAVRSVNRRCRPPPFQPIRQGGRTGAGCRAALARQAVSQVMHSPSVRLLEQIDYQDMYCRQLAGNITTEVLWLRLEPLLWYLPSDEDRQQVAAALQLAAQAHAGQTRKSGEPFITHPLEVTRILAEMRADTDSLIAGLLHDTVEDTEAVSFDDIEARFGTAVRRIVEGETKISKITRTSPDGDDKAKDLQGLFMAMTEDVRIILVKLADRLHNMRTLYGMKPEKQMKISQETLQVFAPLAKLLGVYCIKEELEDLSLMYMQPQLHRHIRSWQEKQLSQYQQAFAAGRGDLEALLAADHYLQRHARSWAVRVRQKSAYSVYKQLLGLQAAKEQADTVVRQETVAAGSAAAAAEASNGHGKKGSRGALRRAVPSAAAVAAAAVAASSSNAAAAAAAAMPAAAGRPAAGVSLLPLLKELPDRGVFLQVIVDELEAGASAPDYQMEAHQLCYYVLGLVHSIWSPIPGALQDFIGSPKTNGYQSLHTRVVPLSILSKNCPLLPMEVQIRTAKMDKLADLGVAATNWGVSAALMRRVGSRSAFLGSTSRDSTDSTDSSTDSYEDEPTTTPAAAPAEGEGAGDAGEAAAAAQPLSSSSSSSSKPAAPAAAGEGKKARTSSRRSRKAAGDAQGSGGSSSSSSGSKARDASSSNGTFWMNLASFMLESMAAGGNSLAAITGVITGGSNGSSSSSSEGASAKPDGKRPVPDSDSGSSSSTAGVGTDPPVQPLQPSRSSSSSSQPSTANGRSSGFGGQYQPAATSGWLLGAVKGSSSSSNGASVNGSAYANGNGNGNGSSRSNGNGSGRRGTYLPLSAVAGSRGVRPTNGNGNGSSSSGGGRGNGVRPGATASRSPAAAAAPTGGLAAPPLQPRPPPGSMPPPLAPGAPFMPTNMPLEQLDSNWLTQMRKWQEEFVGSLSAREFVDGVTAEVLGQSVFVYTHTGELRRLPKGSTVVDFAYSVHTQLGNEMRAALVNGRLVAPSYVLSNGEVVEIRREPGISAASVRRHEQWVGLVHTRSAKLKIKQFIKEHGHLTSGGRRRPQDKQAGGGSSSSGGGGSSGGNGSSVKVAGGVGQRMLEDIQERDGDVVKTLCVRCQDKMGLLALVCSIISDHGHNIKSVSGLPEEDGEYNMTFVIKGSDAVLPQMLQQIMGVDGVHSYSVSCPEDPRSSDEE